MSRPLTAAYIGILMRITFDVPSESTAAQSSRATLEQLSGEIARDVLDILKLLVTELVTNSLRHCRVPDRGWRIEVSVDVGPDVIHARVCNPGDGFRRDPHPPSPLDVQGRGLFLVAQMADRWGISGRGATCVWFELATVDRSVRVND